MTASREKRRTTRFAAGARPSAVVSAQSYWAGTCASAEAAVTLELCRQQPSPRAGKHPLCPALPILHSPVDTPSSNILSSGHETLYVARGRFNCWAETGAGRWFQHLYGRRRHQAHVGDIPDLLVLQPRDFHAQPTWADLLSLQHPACHGRIVTRGVSDTTCGPCVRDFPRRTGFDADGRRLERTRRRARLSRGTLTALLIGRWSARLSRI
jgi:hypothetical protein